MSEAILQVHAHHTAIGLLRPWCWMPLCSVYPTRLWVAVLTPVWVVRCWRQP